MANFAIKSGLDWAQNQAILVQFQQKLPPKYLSGILTDLHRTFRTGLVFLRQSQNESKECYAMIKTDENLNISAESQIDMANFAKKVA